MNKTYSKIIRLLLIVAAVVVAGYVAYRVYNYFVAYEAYKNSTKLF